MTSIRSIGELRSCTHDTSTIRPRTPLQRGLHPCPRRPLPPPLTQFFASSEDPRSLTRRVHPVLAAWRLGDGTGRQRGSGESDVAPGEEDGDEFPSGTEWGRTGARVLGGEVCVGAVIGGASFGRNATGQSGSAKGNRCVRRELGEEVC